MAVVGCEQPHAMSSLFLSSARESLAIERTSEPMSSGLFTMHPDTPAARSASARRQAASRVQVGNTNGQAAHRNKSQATFSIMLSSWSGSGLGRTECEVCSLLGDGQAFVAHLKHVVVIPVTPALTPHTSLTPMSPVDIQIEIREGAHGPPSEAQELPITSSENIEPKFDPMSWPVRHKLPT